MPTGAIALLFIAAILAGAIFANPARSHEPYNSWMMPDNPALSCCNNTDCRPTRAYYDGDHWHAWNGSTWLLVPAGKLLPTDKAGDGRSHLCESGGYVFCFSPGQVRG